MNRTSRSTLSRISTILIVGAAAVALTGCSAISGLFGGGGVVEGEGESTDVFSISVGDCLNDSSAEGEVSAVPLVDCAEPHDSEVYLSIILDDGDFPGQEAISTESENGCLAAFEGFVGTPYDSSLVDYNYYQPTEATWAQGDREIICLAIEYDADFNPIQTTGTLEGSGK